MVANQQEPSMTNMEVLRNELLAAENILDTQYSFEKAEPSYVRCLEVIDHAAGERREMVALITSLFSSGELSDEPIAFLMHKLRWPEVRKWAEAELQVMPNPRATGRPLEKIIAAYRDDWENREFYTTFSAR